MHCKWALVFLILLPLCTPGDNDDQIDHFKEAENMYNRIQQDLKNKYDRRIRPFIGVKPVEVDVFMYVSSLRSISEVTMDYKLELYFREYWQDPRMAYDPKLYQNMSRISLHESYADLIWLPDTFLPNAVHSENPDHRSVTHRALLRLEPDGHLLYSRRLSVVAECPMDLSLYPFDQQVCILSIESYGFGVDDIVYKWVERHDPIVLNQNLQLPDFKIKGVLMKTHNVTLATGTYSRLEACFFFVRSSSFYFVQLFVPATAIVITSWLSLWMEGESTFSDMVEVILAITFLYYSYNTIMPRVSYIKAMDIYLGACFIFVFLSLIKLAILKMLRLHGEVEWKHNGRGRSGARFNSPSRRAYHNRYEYSDRSPYLKRSRSSLVDHEKENWMDDYDEDCYIAVNKANDGLGSVNITPPAPPPPMKQSNLGGSATAPLGKRPSRGTFLYSQMSLDTNQRYRRTMGAGPNGNNHANCNGYAAGGRSYPAREPFTPRAVRFRRIYKKVWIVLYPLSFFGFCIFYFVAYFVQGDDKSMQKCEF